MWRILSPNTEYNGITAGVTFVGGVGETDSDPSDYFQRHGYQVEALGGRGLGGRRRRGGSRREAGEKEDHCEGW